MGSGENPIPDFDYSKGQNDRDRDQSQIPINDRTSNGSFVTDEKSGGLIHEGVARVIDPAIQEDSVL